MTDWILGIDQTGARSGKRDRPLPYCLLLRQDSRGIIQPRARALRPGLESLVHENIKTLLGQWADRPGVVAVDAVLGLPGVCGIKQTALKKCFENAYRSYDSGLREGERHFSSFLNHLSNESPQDRSALRRICEEKTQAQSVFVNKPAQRNIQTGTHRIWRDLGRDTSWFELWPSHRNVDCILLCEVYPSFFWRSVLGLKSRQPKKLGAIKSAFNVGGRLDAIYSTQGDWADAAIAALGTLACIMSKPLAQADTLPQEATQEGWILGLEE